MSLSRDAGSFRDPSGQVYRHQGRILRSISESARQKYETVRNSGVLQRSIEQGFLIPTQEIPKEEWPSELQNAAYVVKHESLPYISYPYEWSFYQLKSAALHHLDFQLMLLAENTVLSDATAYNVQFKGTKPIFIDYLSVIPYEPGSFWLGHRQFCEQFLNPLLLRSKLGIAHNAWYRGSLHGITSIELAALLKPTQKWSWNVLSQVVLLSKLEKRALEDPSAAISQAKGKKFSKLAYQGFLTQLRNWIARLQPKNVSKTVWGDYATTHTYADEEAQKKAQVIENFVSQVKPSLLFDLGCNTGDYSFAALSGGANHVVGFDFDQHAVETAFQRSQKQSAPFLPLFQDATNPTPGQGWRASERKAFDSRGKADAVIALAFEHHLAIGNNVPLEDVVSWIVAIAPKGVIEFVPKTDSTIQRMLSLREDIFSDYSEEVFINALERVAKIDSVVEISKQKRKLFCFSKNH